MKTTFSVIAVIALIGLGLLGKKYFDDQFHDQQTRVLSAQIFPLVGSLCEPSALTHGDTFIHLYCTPKTAATEAEREDLRTNLLNIMDKWAATSPYNRRPMSVRFPQDPVENNTWK